MKNITVKQFQQMLLNCNKIFYVNKCPFRGKIDQFIEIRVSYTDSLFEFIINYMSNEPEIFYIYNSDITSIEYGCTDGRYVIINKEFRFALMKYV